MKYEFLAGYGGPTEGLELAEGATPGSTSEAIYAVAGDWDIPTIPIGKPPIRSSIAEMPYQLILLRAAEEDPVDPEAMQVESVHEVVDAVTRSTGRQVVVQPGGNLSAYELVGWARHVYDEVSIPSAIVVPLDTPAD